MRYISFGAGVQSTALLVMSALGLRGVQRADCAIFADTGDEPAWVYRHLEQMMAWAAQRRIAIHVVSNGCLSENTLRQRRFASIPAFTPGDNGREAMLRRQCTREYKIEPIERKVRQLMGYKPRQRIRETAVAMIGISLDEVVRMKDSRTKWVRNEFPLIDAGMRRGDCIMLLAECGLAVPRKSSCVFCPYHSDAYWRDLKANYPEEWVRAVRFDGAIRNMTQSGVRRPAYVHRSLVPLGYAYLSEDQMDLFVNECEGYCGV